MLLGMSVASILSGDTAFYRTKIFAAGVCLFAVMWLSLAVHSATSGAVAAFLHLMPLILVAPLVLGERRRHGESALLHRLTLIFGGTVAASLLLGAFDEKVYVLGRLQGITMHPNVLALVAAVFAMLPQDEGGRAPQLRRWLRLAAGGATVLLTQSLLGFAMLVIWILAHVAGWTIGRLMSLQSQQVTRFLLVSAATVFLITPFITTQVDLNDILRLVSGDPSQVIRVQLWHSAWLTLLQNPVLGSGFGSLDLVTEHEFAYSHSVVMDYLRSTGILGCMAMLVLLYQIVRTTFALPSEEANLVTPNVSVALPIAFAIIMFSSAEAGLQQLPLSWIMLWFAVGFGVWTTKPVAEKVFDLPAPGLVAAHQAPEAT
jgi:hypothetical protein